jgi:hypothetical protein
MKPPAHRAGLPGHAVACRVRAKVISFILCPFLPAGRQGPRLQGGACGAHPGQRDNPLEFSYSYE